MLLFLVLTPWSSAAPFDAAPIVLTEPGSSAYGSAVSTGGDVNGDGYADLLVGDGYHTDSRVEEGTVYLYLGSPAGPASTAAWSYSCGRRDCLLGSKVGFVRDVDGDGDDEVVAGGYYASGSASLGGLAVLFYGSPAGPASTPDWSVEGTTDDAFYGNAFTSGDFNGDGYGDLAAGVIGFSSDAAHHWEGAVELFFGSATGIPSAPDQRLTGGDPGGWMGSGLDAKDLDGDGFEDLVVGSPYWLEGTSDVGRVQAFLGAASGVDPSPVWEVHGDNDNAGFGGFLTALDVNGDGFGDIVVGAPNFTERATGQGAFGVYLGAGRSLAASPALWVVGASSYTTLGVVAPVGDLDGDGFDDVAVGSTGYTNGESLEGALFVHRGSAAALSEVPDWTVERNVAGAQGGLPGPAGDIDGDGLPDIAVGTNGGENAAYVYLSSNCAEVDADRDSANACVDCDDADPSTWPGAPEIPDDGIDQDCDGADATADATPDDTGGVAKDGGCGCDSTGVSGAWALVLGVLAGATRRRTDRSPVRNVTREGRRGSSSACYTPGLWPPGVG